jgi:hypothetical protein
MHFNPFISKICLMKKIMHHPVHMGNNTKTVVFAVVFLSIVMFLSYLYWF